jgi:hypothetical protein
VILRGVCSRYVANVYHECQRTLNQNVCKKKGHLLTFPHVTTLDRLGEVPLTHASNVFNV